MTQATESREWIQLIRAILSKHSIADLALEMELTQAGKDFFRPAVKRTPSELRQAIEKALQTGAAKLTKEQAMKDRAEIALKKLAYNLHGAGTYEWERLYKHLLEAEAQGETIENFVSWASRDPYWHDKISSINKIMELWPKAFAQSANVVQADGGGLYV